MPEGKRLMTVVLTTRNSDFLFVRFPSLVHLIDSSICIVVFSLLSSREGKLALFANGYIYEVSISFIVILALNVLKLLTPRDVVVHLRLNHEWESNSPHQKVIVATFASILGTHAHTIIARDPECSSFLELAVLKNPARLATTF